MRAACDRCGQAIDALDAHLPHEPGCDRQGCACDLLMCLACCTECSPALPVPGQADLFGDAA